MNAFPFEIYFHADYENEVILNGWEEGVSHGLAYRKAEFRGVTVFVTGLEQEDWRIKIHNASSEPVTGFWEVRFPWRKAEDCFTLVPAVYYDGNEQENLHDIPVLKMPEKPAFYASLSAASYPAVLFKEGEKLCRYTVSEKSIAGWNGFGLNAEKGTLSFFAPAMEKNIYRLMHFDGMQRSAYTLLPRSVLSLHIERRFFDCPTIASLLDIYWESVDLQTESRMKIDEAQGAALVRDWMFSRHCVYTPEKIPLILNAFTDIEGSWPYQEGVAEWNTMIGWCSGSMTALAMLKYGGKYRDFAVDYLDFLAENGHAPTGVKYPVFDGYEWMTKQHPDAWRRNYDHCRFYCDYLHYLGKAIRYEKQNGFVHPAWEKDFADGIRILTEIWEREQDFGLYWNIEEEPVKVYRKGSGCGAFALQALGEGVLHWPEDMHLRRVFAEGCEKYYDRCVASGRCNAGPADIKEADDSESIAALTDALVQYAQITQNEKALQMASTAAKLFSTWVVGYMPSFPGGSAFENLQLCGGVIANTQNRHIGPGICTNSASFLYTLGKMTGDARFVRMYRNIKAAAINCVTTYDGEFYGDDPREPFLKGMMSEQINLSDALGKEGETWRVSTCWPSTAVLLGYLDSPCKQEG